MNPGSATRPPKSSFSAARASAKASTCACAPTAAIAPSRTSNAPFLIRPRLERELPRRGARPQSVSNCDAPVMRRESAKATVLCLARSWLSVRSARNRLSGQTLRSLHPKARFRGVRVSSKNDGRKLTTENLLYDALAALPRYAGTNTCSTNVSYEVGVVFADDLGSSAFMYPLSSASDISQSKLATFLEIPI